MASISALSACVPSQKIENDYFKQWHDADAIKTAVDLVGLNTRYWAPKYVTTMNLNVQAAQSLLDEAPLGEGLTGTLQDHIDVLIFVTQTPDALMPGMAYKAHAALGLPDSCICISVNAGCSGYVENVALASDLLECRSGKYALVLVGDVLSHYLDTTDRSTALIFGDAGTATLVDNVSTAHKEKRRAYVGGCRSSGMNSIQLPLPETEAPNPPALIMNSMEVFNFTISQIPKFIKAVQKSWTDKFNQAPEEDLFLLHQANKMILQHVSKKMKIPADKLPINIQNFGNTSGATIPLLMLDLLKQGKTFEDKKILMLGFGVGLGWGAMIMETAPIHSTGLSFYTPK